MIEQRPMSIHSFKKGDKITRIEPSKPVAKIEDEEIRDRGHIGVPYTFVGIANGCIYLRRVVSEGALEMFSLFTFGGNPEIPLTNLELELYDEGWSYYIDPETLEEGEEEKKISIDELEVMLKNALEKEDYVAADKLQKKINRIKNG